MPAAITILVDAVSSLLSNTCIQLQLLLLLSFSPSCNFELITIYIIVYKKVKAQVQTVLKVIISRLDIKDSLDFMKSQASSPYLVEHVQGAAYLSLLPSQQILSWLCSPAQNPVQSTHSIVLERLEDKMPLIVFSVITAL